MKILVFAFVAAVLIACNSQAPNPKAPDNGPSGEEQLKTIAKDTASRTTVQWIDSVQNFGKVVDGEKVIISFHFKHKASCYKRCKGQLWLHRSGKT